MDKFTRTTESCGEKGRMAVLQVREGAPTPAWTGFYCFSRYSKYIEDGPIYYAQVHFGWLPFTENKGEDVANYIKKEGYLQM